MRSLTGLDLFDEQGDLKVKNGDIPQKKKLSEIEYNAHLLVMKEVIKRLEAKGITGVKLDGIELVFGENEKEIVVEVLNSVLSNVKTIK